MPFETGPHILGAATRETGINPGYTLGRRDIAFQNATLRRLQLIGWVRRRNRLCDPVQNGYPRPP
jgi:hypothetical protein